MHVFSLCHSDYVILVNAVTAVEAHGLIYYFLNCTLMSVSFSEVMQLSLLFVLRK